MRFQKSFFKIFFASCLGFIVSFSTDVVVAKTAKPSGPDPRLKIKPTFLKSAGGSTSRNRGDDGPTAPNGPGMQGVWARPDKEGFLSAPHQDIRATIAEGILTEVEYPSIDRAQTRDTQLVFVVNGHTFLEERKNFKFKITRYPHTLAYHVSSENQAFQIKIEKDILIDPSRPVVVLNYDITLGSANTHIYVLHNPQADNSAGGDASFVTTRQSGGTSEILSYQSDRRGDEPLVYSQRTIQLLVANSEADEGGTGFEGVNDPWTRLTQAFSLDGWYTSAVNGNIASSLGFKVSSSSHFALKLALVMNAETPDGSTLATLRQLAKSSLATSQADLISLQQNQWQAYTNALNSVGQAEEVHMLVMKSLEDKKYEGSMVAGVSIPQLPDRIEALETDYEAARLRTSEVNAGYRRVWIRDAFQMGLALLAGGDQKTPLEVARHFVRVQKSNGNFPQNSWVDETESWTGFQIDQTGFPILLVARLVEMGIAQYEEFRPMVLKAADTLVQEGPWTAQERWEENAGYSPNSTAVICQALLEASWLERVSDPERSKNYASTCNQWRASVLQTTFINSGPLGQGYFERAEVVRPFDVAHASTIIISNEPAGGHLFPENEIIDGGFIQWLISGLVPSDDRHFTSSLEVYDRSATTPLDGVNLGYLRYNHDGYGIDHVGRSWPLLSGERALAALAQGADPAPFVKVMMSSQNLGDMMPEQTNVSACPLGWAHAEVVLVARSVQDKKSFYIPQHVTNLYFQQGLN